MPSEPIHQAGDGAHVSVTEARAGVRRGVSRILWISTGLGVLALFAAWLFVPHHAPSPPASPMPADQSAPPTG